MTTELAKTETQALARPSFIKEGDTRGTENITANDVKFPALKIAQSMSPEVKRLEPAYIEGLQEGMFFNTITREIYGDGPLHVIVVNQLGHRNVEFAPMSEGGGVLDFNVPDGDPRTQFTEDVRDGKKVRVKPRATLFYDYLVIVVTPDGRRQIMTLSFKSTQLKTAKTLNAILKDAKVPSFALQFKARPVAEKRGTYAFYGWRVDPAGWVTEEIYNEASKLYDSMKGKNIVVEAEPDEVEEEKDDIPF